MIDLTEFCLTAWTNVSPDKISHTWWSIVDRSSSLLDWMWNGHVGLVKCILCTASISSIPFFFFLTLVLNYLEKKIVMLWSLAILLFWGSIFHCIMWNLFLLVFKIKQKSSWYWLVLNVLTFLLNNCIIIKVYYLYIMLLIYESVSFI